MVYGVKARPLNFSEYTKLSLTKETIDETRDSIFHSLDYLKMKYNLEYIDDPKNDFVVVEGDVELARKRLQMYIESEFPFRCVDTETTGLDSIPLPMVGLSTIDSCNEHHRMCMS